MTNHFFNSFIIFSEVIGALLIGLTLAGAVSTSSDSFASSKENVISFLSLFVIAPGWIVMDIHDRGKMVITQDRFQYP